MSRPLRSVLIGDVDNYPSEYAFIVNQGMTRLSHWHTTVNIRQPIGVITKRLFEIQPHLIWTHMLLWPPPETDRNALHEIIAYWRRTLGTRVVIHDGDAKPLTRHPHDISWLADLALCNHTTPRPEWNIPLLHWPYGAFHQDSLALPVEEFLCDLLFAGRLDGGIYAERTALVLGLKEHLGERMRVLPDASTPHTLFRTPEVAASAGAVLGYARPDAPGWVDVRAWMYPGAGGVLLYNGDVPGLDPDWHFVHYDEPSVESVLTALEWVQAHPDQIRQMRVRAFEDVQKKHSAVPRVQAVLIKLGLSE